MYKFIIHTEPKTKKNSRPIYRNKATGKTFLGKSKDLVNAETITCNALKEQKQVLGITEPLKGKLFSHLVFYKSTKRRCDMSNLVELANDCMQSTEVIGNDDQFVFTITEKFIDKNDPRTEIVIGDISEARLYIDLNVHPENYLKKKLNGIS
ncbi:MAG TPA: RusA family crossover junction endodeoxyribonuclease [Clostridia bacterium]